MKKRNEIEEKRKIDAKKIMQKERKDERKDERKNKNKIKKNER